MEMAARIDPGPSLPPHRLDTVTVGSSSASISAEY
jgi:hypothetical protein